ncbi:tyrosine-type recombinase/integrase [Streptococcus pneumoniae]
MIQSYTLKNGAVRYMTKVYLGIDPLTGKEIRTTRRGFKTEKEARLAEARLLVEVEEKGLPSKVQGLKQTYTFEEVANLWYDSYKNTVKGSSQRSVATHLRLIIPYFKDMYIHHIPPTHCQQVITKLWDKYKSFAHYISIIQRIFKYAYIMEIIPKNPMEKVIKPRKKRDSHPKTTSFYTKDELKQFFDCLQEENNPQYLTIFRIMAFTGLRIGEVLALKWSDIDFIQGNLTVNRGIIRTTKGQVIDTPKTKGSIRTLSLDYSTIEQLKQWQHEQKKEFFKHGLKHLREENFCFTQADNRLIQKSNIYNVLMKIIDKYNLKRISPHGFRHTHASLLFEAGASMKEVQERLGHSNIKTTMDIYTHVTDKQKEQTAKKFAHYIGF